MDELAQLVKRSAALAEAGDWGEEARRVNGRLVELRPGAAGAWLRLGHACEAEGDLEAAEAAFRTVIRLGPPGKGPRIARRRLIAIAEARKSKRVGDPAEATRTALALRDAGKSDAAEAWFERAAELARDDAEQIAAFAAWASMLRTQRSFRRAHELLLRAFELDGSRLSNKVSFAALAATLADLGRLDAARAELDRLHALHPGDAHLERLEQRLAAAESRRR